MTTLTGSTPPLAASVSFADGMSAARRPTGPFVAILIVLAAFSIGHVVFAMPLAALLFGEAGADTATLAGELFTNVVPFAGALLALWLWVRLKERRPFATLGFRSRTGGALVGAAVGVGMVGAILAAGALTGQFVVTPRPVDVAVGGGVLLALVGFVVQAGTEEVLFRGFLLQAGLRRFGVVVAVVLQAAVFALLHGVNPGGLAVLPLVNLFLFAVFLAIWALRDGGLWVAIGWHVLWNWTQGPVAGVQVSGEPVSTSLLTTTTAPGAADLITGGAFGLEGGLLATTALVLAVLAAALLRRRTVA